MINKVYPYRQKIVSIGGGTGQFTFLRGLVKLNTPKFNQAVVATWDSGGISGELRIAEGILPPGDYIQCLLGLMEEEDQLEEAVLILRDRSQGHPLAHLMAAKAEMVHHGVQEGIDSLRRLFRIQGQVFPVSRTDTDLNTETMNGVHFDREHQLDDIEKDPLFCKTDAINCIYLEPPVSANPSVVKAIKGADKIVIPPGSPYGSILPHLLVKGVSEAIKEAPGKLVLVLNLMTTKGQDHHLPTASSWVELFQYYLGDAEWIAKNGRSKIDYLIVNNNHIDPAILKTYQNQGQKLIEVDDEVCFKLAPGMKIIRENITEYLVNAHLLRHNPTALAKVILDI